MTQYSFRLRFHLREGSRIMLDAQEVELKRSADGIGIKIRTGSRGIAIKDNSSAAIVGGPFASKTDAARAGHEARQVLLAWSVTDRIGVDLGDDRLRTLATNYGLKVMERDLGCPVRNDLHGLDIYEAVDDLVFVAVTAQVDVNKNGEMFISKLRTLLADPPQWSDKQSLAAELYSLSFFETSYRARFLTLMASFEALLQPAERPQAVLEFVARVLQQTDALSIGDSDKQAFRTGLQSLKRESIGQAGRALATRCLGESTYLDMTPAKFFSHCYGLRSQILHAGKTSDATVDLLIVGNAMQQCLGDILTLVLQVGREQSPHNSGFQLPSA